MIAGGEEVGLAYGPEPEGTPVVHGEVEAAVGGAGVSEFACQDEVLPGHVGGAFVRGRVGPDGEVVGGFFADGGEGGEVALPEAVGGVGEFEEGVEVGGVEGGSEGGAPVFEGADVGRAEVFDDFVAIVGHGGVGGEEVVDRARGAGRE